MPMLEKILRHLNNWFVYEVHKGIFTVTGNGDFDFLQAGQYYRIVGSVFNDGLHRYMYDDEDIRQETFSGEIWSLAIPKAVIELAERISELQEKYGQAYDSPYDSENVIGVYSYSKSSGSTIADSLDKRNWWQRQYASELNAWRKISP